MLRMLAQDLLTMPLNKFGVCLPDSCSDSDVRAAFRRLDLGMSLGGNKTYVNWVTSCYSDKEREEKPDYDAADVAML